jgi:hypothetical protein
MSCGTLEMIRVEDEVIPTTQAGIAKVADEARAHQQL